MFKVNNKDTRRPAEACNFIKKETLAQVFSCEFWEIFRKTFFTEHLLAMTLRFRLVHLSSGSSNLFLFTEPYRDYIKRETVSA